MAGSGRSLVPVGSPPKKAGRPKGSGSMYTEEIADEIIERLVDGETLVWICKYRRDGGLREYKTFPNHATVADWADPADKSFLPIFGPRFARARIAQHTNWVESTVDIARNPEPGFEEVIEHSERLGVTIRRARKDMTNHRALKIDTMLKAAARLDPQRWAERLQQPVAIESQDDKTITVVNGLDGDD